MNTTKTKVMHVNCEGDIQCNGSSLEQVSQFKYLGIVVRDNQGSPEKILLDRITATRKSFNALRSNARYLSINNCRVRV